MYSYLPRKMYLDELRRVIQALTQAGFRSMSSDTKTIVVDPWPSRPVLPGCPAGRFGRTGLAGG